MGLWWGASSRLGHWPMSPTSPMPGQLFGVSLPSVCQNDYPPRLVWDMLFYLSDKGPLTQGTFRQRAGVTSCRELKENLSSGAEVHLHRESASVVASVLKDFLRSIPGSISQQTCHHWASVMDRGDDAEKISTSLRLLDQLPRANAVLLRCLSGGSPTPSPTRASDDGVYFSLCTAPSALWPPTSSSPELENGFSKRLLC